MVRVGIDIGGTFTDLVLFDEDTGRVDALKVLTTPREPWIGVLNALKETGSPLTGFKVLVHATTLGTNMFLGQEGLEPPRGLLITNRGFRDIIEIGRQNRPELYNPFFTKPKPLIPRDRRIGVKGRINAWGEVVEDLDREEIAGIARRWCSEADVFIISFLNSYVNPLHEDLAEEIISRECPGKPVVKASNIDPQEKEYERTSTAVVNGLLKPLLSRYLERLADELYSRGFKGLILLMQSNGGLSTIENAIERPAAFIESGPAAGAIAVAYYARQQGVEYALGFDMGGTTAKASSIINGEPLIVREYEVGAKVHMGRPLRGSGYPVRYPYIDLVEVSAGGGTIAWVDPGGAVRVGPLSAGADPGPACYGLGGEKPTITDANLLLGRIPEELAGGRVKLRPELARMAIEDLARDAGLEPVEAAWAIVRIANTVMGKALRLVTIERGFDPRDFTLYAFGGAGPLHAVELAEELGVSRVVIPPHPGVFSSLGLLVADYRHDYYKSILSSALEESTEDLVRESIEEMTTRAFKTLEAEGVGRDRVKIHVTLDMRYRGQAYDLPVPYPGSLEGALQEFERLHLARYGYTLPGEDVIVSTVRVTAYGIVDKPVLPHGEPRSRRAEPVRGRRVYFPSTGWVETPIYDRSTLRPGDEAEGPGVVEASDSTILIPPGYGFTVQADYSILIEARG
ncbi:MAG: hydantoinase/oxoprolinase family protein [Desulfurococcales archaeon]|nr:hydantoinase/oxoprolinase family protein [Desulfurococcales archaeon]